MYTKENAAAHKKAMRAIRYDLKRPRTRKDFDEVKNQVDAMSFASFEQGVQNTQSSFENVFINTMNIIFFKLVSIVNHGVTLKLKKEAKFCFNKLYKMMQDFNKLEDEARLKKQQLNFSLALQRELVQELKSCFKTKKRRG